MASIAENLTVAPPPTQSPTVPAAPPNAGEHSDQELITQFIKNQEEMKANIEKIARKAAGELVAESKADLLERQKKFEDAQTALVKTAVARSRSLPPGGYPGDGPPQGPTLGQAFTLSDEYKDAISRGGKYRIGRSFNGRLQLQLRADVPPATTHPGGHAGAPTPLAAPPPVTEGASGLFIYPRRVAWVQPPEFPLVMRDVLDVIPLTGTNMVEYVTEVWTEAPDYQITEGTRKSQSGVSYTSTQSPVRTIAHFIKVSKQMLADVPYVQTSIDQRMVYLVLRKEDYEVLWGDNSAGHLNGLMNQATVLTIPPAITADVTTFMDAVAAAISQIANNGYIATAIIMNPTDWAGLQLAKSTLGTYILQGPGYGPPQALAGRSLWGLPVLTSINMTAGNFLVGAFPGNAALFDREQAIVEISFENEDDFVNNLATIRCEERVALAVYVPLAFVKGTTTSPFLRGGNATHTPPVEHHPQREVKK